ncbi:MAG: DUF1848 domain-containing protein, partial [Bacteroidetes bacterium]|nr:DUF1848 domain-containing protein [Bacteroidota bacterium]
MSLKKLGHNFYFNYTITGLPNTFECNLVEKAVAVKSLKYLSDTYSPKHINWRYDPIILSNVTDVEFHLSNFEYFAKEFHGYIERCYFSFVIRYGKV